MQASISSLTTVRVKIMTRKQSVARERRAFIKGAAAAGSAVALAAVSRDVVSGEAVTANRMEQPVSSKGYRETPHVKDFYASLRI